MQSLCHSAADALYKVRRLVFPVSAPLYQIPENTRPPGAYQTVCAPLPNNTGPPPALSNCNSADTSAFVTKLNSTGTGLVYSTFLGGYAMRTQPPLPWMAPAAPTLPATRTTFAPLIYRFQSCFPTTSGAIIGETRPGGGSPQYAFVAAFDPTGAQLLYSTLFGDLNFKCIIGCGGRRGPPGSRWMPTAISTWSARPRPATCPRPPASFSLPALLWATRQPMCKPGAASLRSSIRSLPPVEHRWPTPPTLAGKPIQATTSAASPSIAQAMPISSDIPIPRIFP